MVDKNILVPLDEWNEYQKTKVMKYRDVKAKSSKIHTALDTNDDDNDNDDDVEDGQESDDFSDPVMVRNDGGDIMKEKEAPDAARLPIKVSEKKKKKKTDQFVCDRQNHSPSEEASSSSLETDKSMNYERDIGDDFPCIDNIKPGNNNSSKSTVKRVKDKKRIKWLKI